MNITWDDGALEEEGCNALYASLAINGYNMHLEAFEVRWAHNDTWNPTLEAVHPQWEEELEFLCVKCDGPPATFEYKGRLFVALATPYAE